MTKELHYRRSLCCSFDFPPFLRKLSKLRLINLSPLSPNLLYDNGVIFPNMGNGTQVIPGRIVH